MEKERDFKWVMWLPQGLLHAPTRGRKNETRQYKKLSRIFVLWRQKHMEGLIKTWQQASIKAHNMLFNRARSNNGDKARISRAITLLFKGTISRAIKAMESKDLGDLSDPELIRKIQDKHPARVRQIGLDILAFVPEEEVVLKVDKNLGKLNNEAAQGPTGLRNTHVGMCMGAFASRAMETSIEHREDMITDMANDMLPLWFMHDIQGADLMEIIKTEARAGQRTDHIHVFVPNTLNKIAVKAMMHGCKEDYTRDLLPQ